MEWLMMVCLLSIITTMLMVMVMALERHLTFAPILVLASQPITPIAMTTALPSIPVFLKSAETALMRIATDLTFPATPLEHLGLPFPCPVSSNMVLVSNPTLVLIWPVVEIPSNLPVLETTVGTNLPQPPMLHVLV